MGESLLVLAGLFVMVLLAASISWILYGPR